MHADLFVTQRANGDPFQAALCGMHKLAVRVVLDLIGRFHRWSGGRREEARRLLLSRSRTMTSCGDGWRSLASSSRRWSLDLCALPPGAGAPKPMLLLQSSEGSGLCNPLDRGTEAPRTRAGAHERFRLLLPLCFETHDVPTSAGRLRTLEYMREIRRLAEGWWQHTHSGVQATKNW